jgi:hypothetical protein
MKTIYPCLMFLALAGGLLGSHPVVGQEEKKGRESALAEVQPLPSLADREGGHGGNADEAVIDPTQSSTMNDPVLEFPISEREAELLMLGASTEPTDSMTLIQNAEVQREIDLVEKQRQDVQQLHADFQAKILKLALSYRHQEIDSVKVNRLSNEMKQLREEQRSRLKEILLPHQLERLQQISVQQTIELGGLIGALSNKLVAADLGLTIPQIERLRTRSVELNQELIEQIKRLKEDASEKLLAELTPEQNEKLKALTGAKYTYQLPEFKRPENRPAHD